jgi:citrate lyase synthetase
LNKELLTLLDKGHMTYDEAKATIDYLAPNRTFPAYYNKEGNPLDHVQVHGSVSIIDLKELTIETLYGYYSDEWIKLSLKRYIS